MISTLLATAALAASTLAYNCVSTDENKFEAVLQVISSEEIHWSDLSHSASSKGVFSGIDRAPFSKTKGEGQYFLADYAQSEDSYFALSMPQNPGERMTVTEYFDNDDHREGVTQYLCTRDN